MTGGRGKRHAAILGSAAIVGLITYQMAGAQEVPVETTEETPPGPALVIPPQISTEAFEEEDVAEDAAEIQDQVSPQTEAPDFAFSSSLANPSGADFGALNRGRQRQPGADRPSGFNISADVNFGVDIDDNGDLVDDSPGTDTTAFTSLGLTVTSSTPINSVVLSFGGDFQYENLAGDENEDDGFVDPYVNLAFDSEGADSRFEFRGRYNEDDIVDSFFFDTDGDLIEDTILAQNGTVERLDLSATYSFGIDAPFGADLTVGRNERTYSDVENPNLFDRTLDRVGVVAHFQINPAVTAELIGRLTKYEADDVDETERDTTNLGVGLQYQISPDLFLGARLTHTDIEETTVDGVENNDGISAQISLDRQLNNGTIGVFLNRNQFTETARTEAGFSRDMDLPGGSLGYSLGLSWSDTGDTVVVGSLDYLNVLPTGEFTVSLSQTASSNVDDEEVERTVLGVGYSHDINRNSGLDFGVDLAHVKDVGVGDVTDSTRVDYGVSYRHELTADWNWRLGYQGRYRRNDDGDSANSNSIFTSIGRSFSIR